MNHKTNHQTSKHPLSTTPTQKGGVEERDNKSPTTTHALERQLLLRGQTELRENPRLELYDDNGMPIDYDTANASIDAQLALLDFLEKKRENGH